MRYPEERVQAIAENFDLEPCVLVRPGPTGYPIIWLRHPNGAEAVVHSQGGTISSWTDSDNLEMLFLAEQNNFDPCRPIEGGISLLFPVFASGLPGMPHIDTLPTNGFMRNHHMTIMATHLDRESETDACPGVTLYARSCDETRAQWPHDWEMTYQVNLMNSDEVTVEEDVPEEEGGSSVPPSEEELDSALADVARVARGEARPQSARPGEGAPEPVQSAADALAAGEPEPDGEEDDEGDEESGGPKAPVQLHIAISLHNAGTTAFEFQIAAVADFAVKDLVHHGGSVRLVGLGHRHAMDLSSPLDPRVVYNDMDFTYPLTPPGTNMRCVYANANDSDVYFCPGNRQYYSVVWRQGLSDAIVEHPDLREVPYARYFASVGAGKVVAPVRLEPGQVWSAEFCLRKHYDYWYLPFETSGTPTPDLEMVESPIM